MQNDFASLMQTLAPDLAAEISQRALVLERIASMAPVGRRQLAAKLHLTEREIRACADKLREQGFISLDPAGMTLTDKAREILPGIQAFTRAMNDLSGLEEEKRRLRDLYPVWSRTASLAIGYREGDDRERIFIRTCQLAKRQDTWFRHQASAIYVEPTVDSVRECWNERGPWKVVFGG